MPTIHPPSDSPSFGLQPTVNTGAGRKIDRNDSHSHSLPVVVDVSCSLSKRTVLHARAGAVNHHGTMDADPGITRGALSGLPGTPVGPNVGIHHVF
ncbi:hypothetical protein K8353_33000 [Burkholderia contaminans]|nr:hypothetical protein [Burkholderia contaminans]